MIRIRGGVLIMNKDTVEKRQDLRMHLLINLYEHYFNHENKGIKKRYLRIKTEDFIADSEVELAYTYLINKGLVKNEGNATSLGFIITVDGIDLVESHFAK